MGLPCLNCQAEVPEGQAKIFAACFVCETCHLLATRLYERNERELRALLTLQLEAIRVAILEQKLHFYRPSTAEPPKSDVLRAIMKLEELRALKENKN